MSYSYTYGAEVDLPNGYTFRDGQLYNQFGENARAGAAQSYQEMIETTEAVSTAFGPEFGMRTANYGQEYAQQLQSNLNGDLNQVSSRLGGFINLESSDISPGDPFYVAPLDVPSLMPTLIFTPDGSNVEITTYSGSTDVGAAGAAENVVSEVVVTGAVATVLEVNLLDNDQIEQTIINQNGPNSLMFSPFSLNSLGEPYAPFQTGTHMAKGTTRHLTTNEINYILNFYSDQPGFNVTAAQLQNIVISSGGSMLTGINLANFFTSQSIFTYAAATTWNATTIDVDPAYALTDFSTDPATMSLIIHEVEHVDQWLNNSNAFGTFLSNEAAGLFTDIYAFTPQTLYTPFQNLNYETQAQIEEDMFRASNGLGLLGGSGFNNAAGQALPLSQVASELLSYVNGNTL